MLDRRMIDQVLGQLQTGAMDLQSQGGALASRANNELDNRLGDNKNLVGGLAVGGIAALLLSNKKVRKMGKKAAVYGGAAALGAVAFSALKNRNQNSTQAAPAPTQQSAPAQVIDHDPLAGHAAFQTNTPEASDEDRRVRLLLSAMIAAANADGHINKEERGRITAAIEQMGLDQESRLFLLDEMMAPKQLADIARAIEGQQEAAETYLVSTMVVDEADKDGREYLDNLAMVLGLDPTVTETLDAQSRG